MKEELPAANYRTGPNGYKRRMRGFPAIRGFFSDNESRSPEWHRLLGRSQETELFGSVFTHGLCGRETAWAIDLSGSGVMGLL